MECFNAAQGAAATIFRVIDRKSKIDSLSTEGKLINYGVTGNIEFNNVFFHYPSRTDVPVCFFSFVRVKFFWTFKLESNFF